MKSSGSTNRIKYSKFDISLLAQAVVNGCNEPGAREFFIIVIGRRPRKGTMLTGFTTRCIIETNLQLTLEIILAYLVVVVNEDFT